MNYQLTPIEKISGQEATIYSITPNNEEQTLFEKFLIENKDEYKDEIKNIISRLKQIGQTTGARESFFKTNEGKYGDMVCALYDLPYKNLRLYCIRYGMDVVILGGGGEKNVQSWQDNPKLKEEAEKMIQYAKDLNDKLNSGELTWSNDMKRIIEE